MKAFLLLVFVFTQILLSIQICILFSFHQRKLYNNKLVNPIIVVIMAPLLTSKITKNFIEILGKQYPLDSYTNVTPKLLESMERRLYEQKNNPLYLISERIRHFFGQQSKSDIGYKYDEFQFKSPIVTIEDNFDSLLIPKDHVSRRKADTYYVNSQHLFRSHTSAHQMHCLLKGSKAFISIADCYRRDEIDKSHFPVFHQCEVFKLYNKHETPSQIIYDNNKKLETNTKQHIYTQESSSFAEDKLKKCVESFVRDFFDNPNLKTRWVDAYFPFTHPSFELEILWGDKWMEVLGSGIVREEILKNAGIQDHIGFAVGFGLERIGMLKYEIPDIRLFWTKDSGFSHQFERKSPFDKIKFKSYSQFAPCINDLSFWLPAPSSQSMDCVDSESYDANDFYDLCRSIGGDLIEQVTLIDEFTHPKTKRLSHCYRIIYRAPDRSLTKEEINVVHSNIAEACKKQFNCEIR